MARSTKVNRKGSGPVKSAGNRAKIQHFSTPKKETTIRSQWAWQGALKEDWPTWALAWLTAYSLTGNATFAARTARVERTTAYALMERDEAFNEACQEARKQAAELLEDEAWRRAVTGVSKPVYQSGQLVGAVQEYSDTLLIFLMKGAMPGKYRERHEVSGPGGGPIVTTTTINDDERLARITALLDIARARRDEQSAVGRDEQAGADNGAEQPA